MTFSDKALPWVVSSMVPSLVLVTIRSCPWSWSIAWLALGFADRNWRIRSRCFLAFCWFSACGEGSTAADGDAAQQQVVANCDDLQQDDREDDVAGPIGPARGCQRATE